MRRRVTIASSDVPVEHLADDFALISVLRSRGHEAELVRWDDPTHDWSADDLVVIRSTWDYTHRLADFLRWVQTVPRLLNPAELIVWNTDKVYLRELEAAGIPIIPTTWVTAAEPAELPSDGDFVIKPTVSAGARDSRRYTQEERELAREHLDRLVRERGIAMLQPYISHVDDEGETALLFFNGQHSHSMRKGPILQRGAEALAAATFSEQMTPRTATDRQLALAAKVLAAVPGGVDQLLYARVDLVPDANGHPLLIELEATEPCLFLGYAEGAVERLADAIESRLSV